MIDHRSPPHGLRLACLPSVLTLCALLAPGAWTAASAAGLGIPGSAARPSAAQHPAMPLARATSFALRLGTAAGPFGWSTAIADFNDDGQPDLAVVDARGRGHWAIDTR